MENIEYYQNIASEDIRQNKTRNDKYAEIDDMVDCRYSLPSEVSALPYIGSREFWSHAPSNASLAAVRTFATLMPDIDIDPLLPTEEEWERVEKMETAIAWHFKQLNQGRQQPPLFKIVESAVKYCNVSMQTEYLPYTRKGQTGKRISKVKRKGDFNFIVHHPSNVNARFSNDGIECVTLCQERTVYDLINEFGKDNEGVKKYLVDLKAKDDQKGADLRKEKVAFYDYTDWEVRVIWFTSSAVGDLAARASGEAYIIEMKKHGLPFIPWVVFDNQQPLLNNLYSTWANLNVIKTVTFSKHVALAGEPAFAIRVNSAEDDVVIDTSDPLNKLKLLPGQEIVTLPARPIDPQLQKTEADLDAEIHQSSAASILGSVERLSGRGDSFSSMNAILQAALGQLGVVRMTAEQALTEGFHQIFRWIDYSKEPLRAYRTVSKSKENQSDWKGSQIAIMGGEAPEDVENENQIWFDPDELYITVSLKSNAITDEQQRVTTEINKYERLGFSQQHVYEDLGGINFEQDMEQRAGERMFENNVNLEMERENAKLRIWEAEQMGLVQARIQEKMRAEQEAAMANAQNQNQDPQAAVQDANAAGAFAGVEGMDMRAGGQAPQGGAPGVGREQINGADANGVPLA